MGWLLKAVARQNKALDKAMAKESKWTVPLACRSFSAPGRGPETMPGDDVFGGRCNARVSRKKK